MGQQQSTDAARNPGRHIVAHRVNWLEGVQLALITTAVAGLQWLRYQLIRAEHRHHEHRPHHRSERHQCNGGNASKAGDIFEALPPEMRRAAVQLIDYQLTPVLCDQWRLKLVAAFFATSQEPPVPEQDPQIRAALLQSLKEYEQTQRRRTQPQAHPPAQSAPLRPGRPPATAQASTSSQPPPARPRPAPSAPPMNSGATAGAPPGTAPPREGWMTYPSVEDARPSAPPLPAEMQQAQVAAKSTAFDGDPPDDECHICMEAKVEVEIEGCRHAMCIPCARAVCCMPDRAPSCPFCRGPIAGIKCLVA